MIKKAYYIESDQVDPYYNLALEEYLLDSVKEDEIILYLWQNQKTVVIGKNQNSWKECKITELEKDGGSMARRLSGGGAVFHDLGNLNFTFLIATNNYNLDKQMDVILEAVRMLGMEAVKSGRNDITIEGMKFSGNAFYERKGHSYHHGTLMVHVKMEDLQKYLNVDPDKLKSKAVESVRARVTNLDQFKPDLTIAEMKEHLIKALGKIYELDPSFYEMGQESQSFIQTRKKELDSWEFKYGKKLEFQFEDRRRFPWGDLWVRLQIQSGTIKEAIFHSDAMAADMISDLSGRLKGIRMKKIDMITALKSHPVKNKAEEEISKDILGFFENLEIG